MPSRSVHFVIVSLRNVVVIPQWDAVDLEIGAVLAHANCWRKFAISCNSSGLKFAALHESASLIGRLGSSAFRLSTTAASASLAGSCFSTESAHRPFHHGIRRRGGTIFRAALPSDRRQVQADSRTHLIHRPARDTIPPLGGARVSSCRDWFYVALMPVRFPWSSGTLCRQPRCGA